MPNSQTMAAADKCRLRRYAVQIVGQLPEDESEALYVLACVRDLVVDYLNEGQGEARPNVLRLVPT